MVENQGCGSRKEEIRRKENKFQSAYARRIFNLFSHHRSKPKFCFKIKFFFFLNVQQKSVETKGGRKRLKKRVNILSFSEKMVYKEKITKKIQPKQTGIRKIHTLTG